MGARIGNEERLQDPMMHRQHDVGMWNQYGSSRELLANGLMTEHFPLVAIEDVRHTEMTGAV